MRTGAVDAQAWYNDQKANFQIRCSPRPPDEPYPNQETFQRGQPRIHRGVVASGDVVIASPGFQEALGKLIVSGTHRTANIHQANMYEMESYGVGLCCKRRQTPFGMIKGISDLAGVDKKEGATTKDAYRLAAIASASAVAFHILCDATFVGSLPDRARCHGWSRSACVWCEASKPNRCCRQYEATAEHNLFFQQRPCTDIGDIRDATELAGARLFDGIESTTYSTYVEEEVAKGSFSQLLLMFPYSVEELFSFLHGYQELRPLIRSMRELVRKWDDGQTTVSADLIAAAIELGKKANGMHGHFRQVGQFCTNMIMGRNVRDPGRPAPEVTFADVAKKICRVMCLYDNDRDGIMANPAFLLHIFMCGLSVPTLLASQQLVKDYGADEATLISVNSEAALPPGTTVTKCLKFSDRGKLLAVTGSCSSKPHVCGHNAVHRFAEVVRKALGRITEPADVAQHLSGKFSIFPAWELLGKFKVGWNNEYLVPGYAGATVVERERLETYFAGFGPPPVLPAP